MTAIRAVLEMDAAFCAEQAGLLMEAADEATTEEAKAAFLQRATEWLKLATEVSERGESKG